MTLSPGPKIQPNRSPRFSPGGFKACCNARFSARAPRPPRFIELSVFEHSRLHPFLDQADDARVTDPMFNETDHPFVVDHIENERMSASSIQFTLRPDPDHQRIQRIV